MEDDEYIYDDDYPRKLLARQTSCEPQLTKNIVDEQPPPMPAIEFNDFHPDPDRSRLVLLDNHGHHRRRVVTRMDNRSPFPPGFVVGGPGGDPLGGELCGKHNLAILCSLSNRFPKLLLQTSSTFWASACC